MEDASDAVNAGDAGEEPSVTYVVVPADVLEQFTRDGELSADVFNEKLGAILNASEHTFQDVSNDVEVQSVIEHMVNENNIITVDSSIAVGYTEVTHGNEINDIDADLKTGNEENESDEPDSGKPEKERTLQCNECGKMFKCRSEIERHLRIHTGVKPFMCLTCGKQFSQRNNLIGHSRSHSGERPFRCQFCDKSFTHSCHLKSHERIHTGVRPFACQYCNKRFISSSGVTRHERIHTGVRPYKCPHCGQAFTDCGNMEKHATMHVGKTSLKCECGKRFLRLSTFDKHVMTCHRDDVVVDGVVDMTTNTNREPGTIESVSSSSESLSDEDESDVSDDANSGSESVQQTTCLTDINEPRLTIVDHTVSDTNSSVSQRGVTTPETAASPPTLSPSSLQCSPKQLLVLPSLTPHSSPTPLLSIPTAKTYMCDVCKKSFSHPSALDIHSRTHSGVRPYGCAECGKTFTQRNNLLAHAKIHSGEKPHTCVHCGRTFAHASHLKGHLRTHTGDRPYKCPYCDKHFSSCSSALRHSRLHSGQKPYVCPVCSLSFADRANHAKHIKMHAKNKLTVG